MASLTDRWGQMSDKGTAKILDPRNIRGTRRTIARMLYDHGWTMREIGALFDRNQVWALRHIAEPVAVVDDEP